MSDNIRRTCTFLQSALLPRRAKNWLCGVSVICLTVALLTGCSEDDGQPTQFGVSGGEACTDADSDGYATCDEAGPVDCDDGDPYVHPGGSELCNGIDDDCNGEIDEYITGCPTSTIPGPPRAEGRPPAEDDPDATPSAPEQPFPTDCTDADRDGWPVCEEDHGFAQDCNDDAWDIHPGKGEICDGIDENCNGEIDEHITGCSTATTPGPPRAGGRPPAEDDPDATPSAPEQPFPADCTDADRDGWPVCEEDHRFAQDCDDDAWDIHPGKGEICDGIDENCNGEIDEHITGCPTSTIPGPPRADGR